MNKNLDFVLGHKWTTYCIKINPSARVLFSPNSLGLPAVINDVVYDFYNKFKSKSLTVNEIMHSFCQERGLEWSTVENYLSFLCKRGFLDLSDSPNIPEAFPDVNSIDSLEVWLHITNECNLKCDYCFVTHKNKNNMSESTMEKIVASIVSTADKSNLRALTIKYSGGEASLVKDKIRRFNDLLKKGLTHHSDFRINSAIITNGTNVDDNFINLIKELNASVSISLDGFGRGAHDIYRRFASTDEGSWDIILENVALLVKHKIKLFFLATISQETCTTMPQLVQWALDNNFRIRLDFVEPTQKQESQKDYDLTIDTLISALEKTFSLLEDPKFRFNLKSNLVISNLSFNTPTFSFFCMMGVNHLVIQEDGTAVYCPREIHSDYTKSHQLTDNLLELTRAICPDSPLNRNQDCLDCRWFSVCAGGCPSLNILQYGSAVAKNPFHRLYQYIIPRYIKLLGIKLYQYATDNGAKKNFSILYI